MDRLSVVAVKSWVQVEDVLFHSVCDSAVLNEFVFLVTVHGLNLSPDLAVFKINVDGCPQGNVNVNVLVKGCGVPLVVVWRDESKFSLSFSRVPGSNQE